MLPSYLIAKTDPKSDDKQIISGEGYRITVLTDRLIRVETDMSNKFTDEATQCVWFRNFSRPAYKTDEQENLLKIITDSIILVFNKSSKKALYVEFKNGTKVKCNNKGNLLGTARTLDRSSGKLKLNNGVISKTGVAVFEDGSLLLDEKGEVKERIKPCSDKYIFAYGNDYRGAIYDFYKLTGEVPLIPRYALGNWWSRYRAYTQNEYTNLMQRFIDEEVPISVATIDMDWHWVKVNEKFGEDFGKLNLLTFQSAGWTGYSWNTDLFPDYKGFLKWLQDRNLKVTVNLHPAQGVRKFEDMYEAMANELGVPADGSAIPFDITSADYMKAYFKILHTPYEKEGVDFWWIDWQQGKNSKLEGLDPLWSLNHYHFLDSAKNGKLPLILSRYAGAGSHRYPLGFSGDTFVCWNALKFQPYFTVNSANIGYTWWSHDIGGHMFGVRDDEMYLRWLQFGVFSPINRLHSTSDDLSGKEPWNYRKDVELLAKDCLRFRHSMIPYIYTMDYRNHKEGFALCEPMYYGYDKEEAYKVKNQYMFGSELMVCPITDKIKKRTGLAGVKAWIPEGRWTDIFTGCVYDGKGNTELFRDEGSIPVLAKSGAIIPMAVTEGNFNGNPEKMDIWAYRGDNKFTLYEDEGYGKKQAFTAMEIKEDDGIIFKISAVSGEAQVVPEEREYTVKFKDIKNGSITVKACGKTIKADGNEVTFKLKASETAELTVKNYEVIKNPEYLDIAVQKICRLQGSNIIKRFRYGRLKKAKTKAEFEKLLKNSLLPRQIKKSIKELL